MMKRILALLLALMLLASSLSVLAEAVPANTAVTIDGVRVAFFDTEGNYLQPVTMNGLLWAPLASLAENLGLDAQIQGQSVMVNGLRLGMFDAEGNFLTPAEVNGVMYVPLLPFCESAGIQAAQAEGKILITRAAAAPTAAPIADPNVKAELVLTESNITDYFHIDIRHLYTNTTTFTDVKTAKIWEAFWEVSAYPTVTCELRNVAFSVTGELTQYGEKAFFQSPSLRILMPASGSFTETVSESALWNADSLYMDTYCRPRRVVASQVSGSIYVAAAEADKANQATLAQAMRMEKYADASDLLDRLEAARVPGVAEARAQLKSRREENYAQAVALQEAGDFAGANAIYATMSGYLDVNARVKTCNEAIAEAEKDRAYRSALEMQAAGMDKEAAEAFSALGDYKDSAQRAANNPTEQLYQQALEAHHAGKRSEGIALLLEVGDYRDAQELLATYDALNVTCVGPYGEGLIAVEIGGKWGFANTTGQLVIPCQWDAVEAFSDGLARVFNGDTLLPVGGYPIPNGKGSYGFINTQGEMVLPMEYDYAASFKNGYASVGKSGKRGVIDTTGKTVIPFHYDTVFALTENRFYIYQKSDKLGGVIDLTGKEIIPRKYNGISYADGIYRLKENDKWGYADETGKVIIKPQYNSASLFVNGYAYADGTMIDKTGKVVIKNVETLRSYMTPEFHSGLALTSKGFIDTTGKLAIKADWTYAWNFDDNGVAWVQNAQKKWGLIDTTGRKLIGYSLDTPYAFDGNGLAKLESKGKFGLINTQGQTVIEPRYDYVASGDGLFFLVKNKQLTILGEKKNTIYPRSN